MKDEHDMLTPDFLDDGFKVTPEMVRLAAPHNRMLVKVLGIDHPTVQAIARGDNPLVADVIMDVIDILSERITKLENR